MALMGSDALGQRVTEHGAQGWWGVTARADDGWVSIPSERDERLARICTRLQDFADEYANLPLYSRICHQAARDDEAAGLLLAAAAGQGRPVLLLAALHELVLRRGPEGTPAARWYSSVVGSDAVPVAVGEPGGDPWPDVRETLRRHREELAAVIASRTVQTNEVNRATYVQTLLRLAADTVRGDTEAPLPIALVEAGASAGLLLDTDRYDISVGAPQSSHTLRWGDPDSSVHLSAEDRTAPSESSLRQRGLRAPRIVARLGMDVAPVDVRDSEQVRWLEACLWPEVPGRVERFRAAVAQQRECGLRAGERAREHPSAGDVGSTLRRGDLADPVALTSALRAAVSAAERPPAVEPFGARQAARDSPLRATGFAPGDATSATPGLHVVLLTSWALSYLAREDRERPARVLAGFSAATGLPVTWCLAEPAGALPAALRPRGESAATGHTVLATRTWRAGVERPPVSWGVADPHGTWITLTHSAGDAPGELRD